MGMSDRWPGIAAAGLLAAGCTGEPSAGGADAGGAGGGGDAGAAGAAGSAGSTEIQGPGEGPYLDGVGSAELTSPEPFALQFVTRDTIRARYGGQWREGQGVAYVINFGRLFDVTGWDGLSVRANGLGLRFSFAADFGPGDCLWWSDVATLDAAERYENGETFLFAELGGLGNSRNRLATESCNIPPQVHAHSPRYITLDPATLPEGPDSEGWYWQSLDPPKQAVARGLKLCESGSDLVKCGKTNQRDRIVGCGPLPTGSPDCGAAEECTDGNGPLEGHYRLETTVGYRMALRAVDTPVPDPTAQRLAEVGCELRGESSGELERLYFLSGCHTNMKRDPSGSIVETCREWDETKHTESERRFLLENEPQMVFSANPGCPVVAIFEPKFDAFFWYASRLDQLPLEAEGFPLNTCMDGWNPKPP